MVEQGLVVDFEQSRHCGIQEFADHVFEFPHAARPVVIEQACRKTGEISAGSSGAHLSRKSGQRKDLILVLTQRQHMRLDDIEPV